LLAQKVNLEVIRNHGLLITPNQGPSIRLSAIFADIENLPINLINEEFRIQLMNFFKIKLKME
jgi:epoxyqueuosine reductase QueG